MLRELTVISPPSERPHGWWYIRGPLGCAMAPTLIRACRRYLWLKAYNDDNERMERGEA